MSIAGLSGFSRPSTGCLTAALMVLVLVGLFVGAAALVWFFGLKEIIGD